MVRHTLKILQHFPQDFQSDYFTTFRSKGLNHTLLSLPSREIDKNVTKLDLLYVAGKLWHRNI